MTAVLTATAVIRRLLVTPIRIIMSAVLAGIFLLIAVASNLANEVVVDDLIMGGLLGFVIPIIALVFAVGALGDPKDDGTLVYLWLKPIPRWQLAVAALLATWQFVVPIAGATGALVAVLGGEAGLIVPAFLACALAGAAYSSLFIGLGLRTTKSLLAGIIFVLIWEGFLSALSDGIATLSVRRWTTALFDDLGNIRLDDFPSASAEMSAAVLLLIVAAGLALTTRWLTTRDVP